jgi:AcrR family transcriptional regulator
MTDEAIRRTGAADRKRRRAPGAGRRRDPAIDEKLRHAARQLYAREGWAGYHFEGVARAAGVSKDAVYRRYADPQALLLDALSDQSAPALAADRPVEEALIAFAADTFSYFASGTGYANLRVHVDGAQHPRVLEQYRTHVVGPQLAQAVDVLERARQAGQLDPGVSPSAVIEALAGAVMLYALATAPLDNTDPPDDAAVRQFAVFVRQILHGRGDGPAPNVRS